MDIRRTIEEQRVLEDHPDHAKVWRDVQRNCILVTVRDDFAFWPDRYEFVGYVGDLKETSRSQSLDSQ
ncbi:MAG TPA: hypothetical protein PKD55_00025 [Bellilinea sp.]|nr:hypothetical protein [Bellilinea sp.]